MMDAPTLAPAALLPPSDEDTFHDGERAMQLRAGVRERLAEAGPRVIRRFMPEQHRAFFTQLPFLVAGSIDAAGQPWASVLAGPAGFVQSPSPEELLVQARPLAHDPLGTVLTEGAAIGLLGIEPHTRRRNRMNGTVHEIGADGFSVRVAQSFGNCPQYIQARAPEYRAPAAAVPAPETGPVLDDEAIALVRAADTFYVATAHPGAALGGAAARPEGVDVSHRGGKPGFVRVDGRDRLTVPDFLGNFFFNTLGNLVVEPRCGLLFIDFDSGDLLQISARGTVVWDGPELASFAGAQRLLRLQVTGMRRLRHALPLRWGAATPAAQLARTGAWEPADARDAVQSAGSR
jgi:uncharacterized protein